MARVTAVGSAVVLVGLAVAACGSSSPKAAPPTSRSAPATTSPAAATTTTTTVPAPTTTVFGQGVVGAVVTGAGATLVAPGAPTTVPYNPSCQVLVDPGYSGQCVIIAAPTGTIAALVETQSSTGPTPATERDLVYRHVSGLWDLVLRRASTGTSTGATSLEESDLQRDGDPKAVFVTPANNQSYGNELDVVEGSGVVSLYRQLHGGFATVASPSGLETFTASAAPATGYDEAVINYNGGAWRITSDMQVSTTQAQASQQQGSPFTDQHGTMATYFSNSAG